MNLRAAPLCSLLTLAACGAVDLHVTSGSSGRSRAASDDPPTQETSAPTTTAANTPKHMDTSTPQPNGSPREVRAAKEKADDDAAVTTMYRALDYKIMTDDQWSGVDAYVSSHVKLHYTYHPYAMASAPDPEWLPRWDVVQAARRDDMGWEALLQAAANRTWTAACEADWVAYKSGWAAIEAKVPELAAGLRATNPYEKMKALMTARARLDEEGKAAHLLLPNSHPYRWSGGLWDATKALMELIHTTHRDFRAVYLVSPEDRARFMEMGHPRSDDASEHDAFVAFAMEHGTQRTPALPTLTASHQPVNDGVKWPLPKAKRDAINAQLKAGLADRTKLMTAEPLTLGEVGGDRLPNTQQPTLFSAADYKVVSVNGQSIVLTHTTRGLFYHDCKTTDKVDHVESNGHFVYQQLCQTGTTSEERTLHATASDLPANMLAAGDQVDLDVDLVSKNERNTLKSANRSEWKNDYQVTVRHVDQVRRNGAVVAQF